MLEGASILINAIGLDSEASAIMEILSLMVEGFNKVVAGEAKSPMIREVQETLEQGLVPTKRMSITGRLASPASQVLMRESSLSLDNR